MYSIAYGFCKFLKLNYGQLEKYILPIQKKTYNCFTEIIYSGSDLEAEIPKGASNSQF